MRRGSHLAEPEIGVFLTLGLSFKPLPIVWKCAMKRQILIVLLAFFCFSGQLFAASYMKFDGVDGESLDKDHKGWINVISVSAVVSPRDAASGLPSGKRQHKPISVTKPIDKSSPMLARCLSDGTTIKNVKIKTDGHVTVLKNAEVISITADGRGNEVLVIAESGGGRPVIDSNTDMKRKGKVEASWKVEEGTK